MLFCIVKRRCAIDPDAHSVVRLIEAFKELKDHSPLPLFEIDCSSDRLGSPYHSSILPGRAGVTISTASSPFYRISEPMIPRIGPPRQPSKSYTNGLRNIQSKSPLIPGNRFDSSRVLRRREARDRILSGHDPPISVLARDQTKSSDSHRCVSLRATLQFPMDFKNHEIRAKRIVC